MRRLAIIFVLFLAIDVGLALTVGFDFKKAARGQAPAATPTPGAVQPANIGAWRMELAAGGQHLIVPWLEGVAPQKGIGITVGPSSLTLTRLTDLQQLIEFIHYHPGAPPKNMVSQATAKLFTELDGHPDIGQNNGYSKFSCLNADGTLIMAQCANGFYGIWDAKTLDFIQWLALSQFNAVTEGMEPRWSRRPGEANMIYYHGYTDNRRDEGLFRQNVLELYKPRELVMIPTLDGRKMFDSGGEGDFDSQGRYLAALFTDGQSTPVCGVIDVVEARVLPGAVMGKPNALDMSPSGKYMAWLNHEGGPSPANANAFYRVEDLARGIVAPIGLQSSHPNDYYSVGHNGWSYDAEGREVLVYQDNRDDSFAFAHPEDGISIRMFHYADWDPKFRFGQHIAANKNPACRGWALFAATSDSLERDPDNWAANQLIMVELKPAQKHPRIWRLGSLEMRHVNYMSEGFASFSMDSQAIFWGGNWNGTDNMELYRMILPDKWWDKLNNN